MAKTMKRMKKPKTMMIKPKSKPMMKTTSGYKAQVISPFFTYRFRFSGGTLG